MSISSCDHDDFIVVYDSSRDIRCPVCELEDEIKSLVEEVEYLKENN